jgi:hypothetical protein
MRDNNDLSAQRPCVSARDMILWALCLPSIRKSDSVWQVHRDAEGCFMVAMNDIQAVVDRIAEAYDPECVVLFGSYARGTATNDLDTDPLARRLNDTHRRNAQSTSLDSIHR